MELNHSIGTEGTHWSEGFREGPNQLRQFCRTQGNMSLGIREEAEQECQPCTMIVVPRMPQSCCLIYTGTGEAKLGMGTEGRDRGDDEPVLQASKSAGASTPMCTTGPGYSERVQRKTAREDMNSGREYKLRSCQAQEAGRQARNVMVPTPGGQHASTQLDAAAMRGGC